MELIDRINKNLPNILDENHCWIWNGAKDRNGYGIISHYSDSLKELHCLHKCDNPSCVNPLHLFEGTNLDNVKDKILKGRCYTGYQKGEHNGASKLKDADVIEIRKLYKTKNYTTIKLGEMYEVHRSTISYIINNKTYTHLLEN